MFRAWALDSRGIGYESVPLLSILGHFLSSGDGDDSSFIEINSHTIKTLHLKSACYWFLAYSELCNQNHGQF